MSVRAFRINNDGTVSYELRGGPESALVILCPRCNEYVEVTRDALDTGGPDEFVRLCSKIAREHTVCEPKMPAGWEGV